MCAPSFLYLAFSDRWIKILLQREVCMYKGYTKGSSKDYNLKFKRSLNSKQAKRKRKLGYLQASIHSYNYHRTRDGNSSIEIPTPIKAQLFHFLHIVRIRQRRLIFHTKLLRLLSKKSFWTELHFTANKRIQNTTIHYL